MKRLHVFMLLTLLSAAGCGESANPVEPAAAEAGTPVTANAGDPASQANARFIVTLAPTARPAEVAAEHGVEPEFVYQTVLKGFAGVIGEVARAGLLKDARVVRVEKDQEVTVDGSVQPGATWGLDRVDQRASSLDGAYTYDYSGVGVTVYIVDTGIRYSHEEFAGRASPGFNVLYGDGSDCHGHGTHVAGTVAGSTYGVAKAAHLVSVRVLQCNGSGSLSGVIAGLDWIGRNATGPAVANMSLGGTASFTLDDAVERLVSNGVTTVVAAGNNNADACGYSPAGAASAITVGATTSSDTRSSFSNYGSCLDLFAPGSLITSSYYTSNDATSTMSGTSMASPHVAGAAALYLSEFPDASPAEVAAGLAARATHGVVANAQSGHADLLYTLGDGTTSPPPAPSNQAPSASFSFSCTDLSCVFTDGSSDADGSVAGWNWSFGDGATAADRSPTHVYPVGGSYQVTLRVTDDIGATATTSQQVTVQTASTNAPPTPGFNASCDGLWCSFSDASVDGDGQVVSWTWDFGDGSTQSFAEAPASPTHAYTEPGSFDVRLTVTDDDGASATTTRAVTVAGITLTVAAGKDKGRHLLQ